MEGKKYIGHIYLQEVYKQNQFILQAVLTDGRGNWWKNDLVSAKAERMTDEGLEDYAAEIRRGMELSKKTIDDLLRWCYINGEPYRDYNLFNYCTMEEYCDACRKSLGGLYCEIRYAVII